MKNCGSRFHSEVGKFRFLNELVKVISPKVRDKSARLVLGVAGGLAQLSSPLVSGGSSIREGED